MLKEVTKNLQATSPTYTRSPLRESMQTGLTVTKGAGSDNPYSMATAIASSNAPSVGLAEGGHSGVMNGELSLVEKNTPIKLTIKRKTIPSDNASASPIHEDCVKSDNQGNVPIIGHSDTSTHRHTVVNGKVLPSSSSSSSLSHSAHGEQSRTTSKRTSGGPSATKRPKSTSKRDRNSAGKSAVLPMSSSSPSLVNGRPSSAERSHDPYQFSVKKEEETVLPPKKLRLDSSLSRLPDRTESFKDQGTNTRSQGTTVDCDLLGPCEPGTQITLGGYVCLETVTGMLMVSVRWRNRTYLGTLIDSTSHGFSPPVPPSYTYHCNRYSSAVETGANSSSSNGNGRNQRGRGKRRCGFAPATGARHSRKGRRNARGSPVTGTSVAAASLGMNAGDDSNEETQSRGESPASENPLDDGEPSFKCPQPGCHKRFKDGTAGKYHMDECHAKKLPDLPADTECREKRPKAAKATVKSKKHAPGGSGAARVSNSQAAVKSEPVATGGGASSSELRTVKAAETVSIKSESTAAANIPPSFFKTPINNGLTSPPLLPYSPTSPAPHPPASPANGLKHPGSGSGNSCSPDTLTLPLNASSHQMKLSPSTAAQQIPPPQTQQPSQPTQPPPQQSQHELPVRIPTTNMLMRVGVTSTAGGTSISSSTISSVNSSVSAPRTVTATTVKTIPVMKPSTVASSSSLSASSASGSKKVNSKESKNNSGNGKSGNARSHVTGTVSASTVTVPSVSSPLSSSQTPGTCSTTLKPIQPKPLVSHIPSPTGNNGCKNSTAANSSAINDSSAKRPSNANPSRKRKKSSGTGSDSGKRQTLSSSSSGNASRTSQGKPVAGGKRSSGNSGSACSEGTNAGQGDRASPAYSDISDDNESPIPILEKEGDVKLLSDNTGGCDEVGKASEQASGSGAFYNTPPSLVPYAVYSGADQGTVAGPGGAVNAPRTPNPSVAASRPTSLGKKAGSPMEGLPVGSAPPLGEASTPVIPGTLPLALSVNTTAKKVEGASSTSVASVKSMVGNDMPEKTESKLTTPSRVDQPSTHASSDEHVRPKKSNEPPNLTKISTPTPLSTLSLPSTASATTPNSAPTTTVAKPTPVNPLSPSRSSSDLPTSSPAVVTPGPLVGGSRASELYANRPDHLPTPPSFHPTGAGGPFGPGAAQFAAHLSSPGPLGPQGPFNQYTDMMRFVHSGGPHPGGHPFGAYPYPAEPFFASPPVSSAPQPHKIHELVEKVATTSTPASTSNAPGIPSLCNTTSTSTACSVANKPPVSVETPIPMDLQTAKSYADMAVAMRHHASILPNHGGLPQGPTHAGMVPHFPYSSPIPPAHMAAPPFAAMQQHALPPGHPPTPGPDPFFPPSTILNHHNIYK